MQGKRGNSKGNRFERKTRGPQSDAPANRSESSAGKFNGPAAKNNFKRVKRKSAEELVGSNEEIRLNRFLSISGICSRREADDLIAAGLVEINGKVVTSMGYKVQPSDQVKYNGSLIRAEQKRYILLNKPKGFLATMEDAKARKTVQDLVGKACKERIYPVGRMDRGTTGVLLFTNDADLAKKLTHPKHGAQNIYHVVLDKGLSQGDLNALIAGITLDDGPAKVDKLHYIDERNPREVGLEMHMGRNRIVHRMFEHLGYQIEKLDRTNFAGLTKKNLNRGHYRALDPKEVQFLKTR